MTFLVDVYAFGCVLIELFGNQPLWGDLQPMQIMYKVGVEGKKPEHNHIPEEIKGIVAVCLEGQEKRASSIKLLKLLLDVAAQNV